MCYYYNIIMYSKCMIIINELNKCTLQSQSCNISYKMIALHMLTVYIGRPANVT